MRPDSDAGTRLVQLINQMRRLGLGERVLKTALAAGVAWQLALLVPGDDNAFLAPLSAVLMMQLTIAQSVDRAIQRTIGVAFGVAVAVIAYSVLGVHSWTIALVVLISLAGGIQLRLSQPAMQQVAISALVVLLASSIEGTAEYAGLSDCLFVDRRRCCPRIELVGRSANLCRPRWQGDRTDVAGSRNCPGRSHDLTPKRYESERKRTPISKSRDPWQPRLPMPTRHWVRPSKACASTDSPRVSTMNLPDCARPAWLSNTARSRRGSCADRSQRRFRRARPSG